MYVSVSICHIRAGAHGGQKVSDPLGLELQEVVCHPVWVLWAKLISGKAASARNLCLQSTF